MTTIELYEFADEKSRFANLANGLVNILGAVMMWRRRRDTVLRLASLDASQLQDIGLEPTDVVDALDGKARQLWAKVEARNAIR